MPGCWAIRCPARFHSQTAWLMKGTVFIPLLKVVTVGIAVGLIVGIIVAWMGGRRYRTPRNLSIVVPVQVLDIYFHHAPASKGYHIAWLCSHTNSFILFFFFFFRYDFDKRHDAGCGVACLLIFSMHLTLLDDVSTSLSRTC